ncbi:MAG: Na+/H+ antiporter subunit E [Acidimicrobiales bacterium]|nr:Na+/H+ antiporter subunit E [Acidimicrobiales bacterium]
MKNRPPGYLASVLAIFAWGFLTWLVLTWTRTTEQLVVGAVVAALAAFALAPFGRAYGPWWFFTPRRLLAVARLLAAIAGRIVVANVKLSARIWTPRRPLSSGMIVVATHERRDGGLAATGLISSLVVDNQIVDLDRRARHLQYHAVAVPEGSRRAARGRVNGPVEDLLEPFEDRRG